ncbi:SpaA isopeptide-forming pilin-related protein [Faecalibacterium hattorii]|uniref:SpaA isopeptide-forming pilin-related protein n=1 Tax=Faecalibacterium hattorii TaxID=2935520 RepID=UPI003AAC8FEC
MDAMGFAYLTEGEDAAYEAIPGDVVTYNKNGTADDETIGIVETVGDDSLTVISGAVEGAVAEVTVPFTDVTSTILVDQAYGDYVGEADDRDGSDDDEIAVQPADEMGAAAVDASEDIFNITGALNLNDEKNQKDLGLTFTFQKLVGNEYGNVGSNEIIEEGDNVQVVVGFKAPAGTFKTGQNGNKAYYNLPYKLAEPLSNKDITDNHGNKIGRMDVNTDGLVVITFSDNVADFNYKEYFEGTFKVWGKAFAKDDSTSDTITFPGHGNSFTLKKKSDISIHKDVDSKIIVEDGRTYFKYTIKVDSTNGTAGETVTIKDNIKNLWQVTGQFDKASFKLTKNGADAAIPVGYPKIETKSDGTSNFTIEGLEALQARENYTLTYLYEITNANTLKKTGSVENSATASYGNNTTNPAGTYKQIMSPELSVKKEGVYGGNNTDTVMTGRVLWTITVDNPSGRDLNGFKVTDTVKTEGVIILDQNDVKGNIIQIKDGNNNKVDKIVNGKAENGEAKVSNDKRSFEYTFPANSTSTKYTFTYCTTVPLNHSAGSVQVSNRVDIDKGSEHYDDDESVNVSKREALLLKVPLGGTELEADNNRLKTVWELVIRSDASADTAKKFTIRDYFKNPTNQSNQTMDHYADKRKLEEELTAVGSENNEKGLFFDVLVNGAYRRVYGIEAMKALGADVTIQYYTDEDSKKEADENTDKVRSFTITVDWKGSTTPLSVVQIHAKGYTTYVDSADSLESGEKLSIYNYIKAGGKEQGAKSDYEKPTKKKPSLGKLVSASEWTGFKGSADIDYTGENTLIWYKLLLKNLDANEATVKDTLPAGLEYTGTYYVGWSTAETEGRNSTDKLLPFVTGGKNEGADNIQYLEKPTVTGTADAGQELGFKLKNLNTLKNPKEGSYQIAIIFSVKVTDDYWDDISENPTKKYPNEATWNRSDKIAKADAFVTRKNSYVEKKNDYVEGSKKEVTYTVEINKEGKTLLSTAGKKLVLHDVLTVPSKISAEIDLQSIKLYDDGGNDVTTRMKCKPDEVVDDGTNKTYKITVEVPDSAHYTLKYTYKFIVPDNVAYGAQYQIKNTVDMFGNSETPSELVYKHSGAAGSVTQDNTNTLKVYKVETDKFYNTLPGATFKLTHWDGSKWSEADGNYTTDADGQILFRYTDQVKENIVNVNRGVLYKLEETAAPNGYIGDSTPHYFLMLDANQTKEKAYAAVSNAKVAEANIRFVAANKTELMHVENTAKQITIRKVWQDANGKQETNVHHEPITVKITRYKDGIEDTAWPPKSITLSSDNDWTYIYPDSSKSDDPLEDGYTYAVEEETVPAGYNVSYTDSKGTERHTGLTSGDSVTITNMKKTKWLIVEKKWLAEGGTTTLTDLPNGTSITLKLYKVDGTDPVQTKTLTKGDGNNWKWKVTKLDPNAKYYVVEEPTVKGFEVSYSHSVTRPASPGDTVIVTNMQKSTKTTLEVVKKWLNTDGMELKDNLPADSIIVQLYKLNVKTGKLEEVVGKTLPLNESNGWTGIFTDLEPDGQYTVKEVSVPDGYTVSYSVNEDEVVVPGATITVTNRKNAPGYELPATGSTGTAPYTTAGAVLMGAALVGGYRRKRRQERRGE